jgi:XTP/dITP diphosphohydrolase
VKLVLASANAGKQREFAALLAPLGLELVLQAALGIDSVAETGTTFEDNALLKARHAAARHGCRRWPMTPGWKWTRSMAGPASGRRATPAPRPAMTIIMRGCWRNWPACRRTRGARYRCVLALVRAPRIARR